MVHKVFGWELGSMLKKWPQQMLLFAIVCITEAMYAPLLVLMAIITKPMFLLRSMPLAMLMSKE